MKLDTLSPFFCYELLVEPKTVIETLIYFVTKKVIVEMEEILLTLILNHNPNPHPGFGTMTCLLLDFCHC